jgi:hypothetical protein
VCVICVCVRGHNLSFCLLFFVFVVVVVVVGQQREREKVSIGSTRGMYCILLRSLDSFSVSLSLSLSLSERRKEGKQNTTRKKGSRDYVIQDGEYLSECNWSSR